MNSDKKLLLACDLDGTVLPNGTAPLSPYAFDIFSQLVARENVCLAYLSGRSFEHAFNGIKEFGAPFPDFYVGDTGTSIYLPKDNNFELDESWHREIGEDWEKADRKDFEMALSKIPGLALQEQEHQGKYKISFYFSPNDEQVVSDEVKVKISDFNINAVVTTLTTGEKGYLDVIPKLATKEHALKYLQKKLSLNTEDVIFAGDGGNDLDPITSEYNAIVVNNASSEFKKIVVEGAKIRGTTNTIYFANGSYEEMNGNYVAGILEGLNHFRKIQ